MGWSGVIDAMDTTPKGLYQSRRSADNVGSQLLLYAPFVLKACIDWVNVFLDMEPTVHNRLPDEKVSACPDCAWNCVEFISNDPCNNFTEQEAEVIAIIDKDAITMCPRTREALKAIKTYTMNIINIKLDKFVDKTYAALCK